MSPITGINAPLLPDDRRQGKGRASVSGAVFNVSTSMVGAGIMSIPATLKVLGVIPALALILVVAWLADISAEFMLRFTRSGETMTYANVMGEAFGKAGSVALQVCVMVTNFGAMVMYLIIIEDVLSGTEHEGTVHLGLLQEWFGIHWWNSRALALFFVTLFVMLPLVSFKRIDFLKFSSAISVLLAVLFVGICSVLAVVSLVQRKTKNPRLFPHLDTQTSFFDLSTAVPVIVTAFTFHFNVHPINSELDKPSDMILAVRISLLICASVYFAIGVFGYILFGEAIMPDILVNFGQDSETKTGAIINDIVRISYALHLMLVYPLLNFSLRSNIDEFLFKNKPILAKDSTRFASITLILLALTYLAAIAIPNIWYFFQFMGSTTAMCLAFIFPGAVVLRDVYGVSTMRDRIVAAVMIVLAVMTSIIAIATNICSFI